MSNRNDGTRKRAHAPLSSQSESSSTAAGTKPAHSAIISALWGRLLMFQGCNRKFDKSYEPLKVKCINKTCIVCGPEAHRYCPILLTTSSPFLLGQSVSAMRRCVWELPSRVVESPDIRISSCAKINTKQRRCF